MSSPIRVGVLRGGPSSEYEVSLNTGAHVLNVLRTHFPYTYVAQDIFVDRSGVWHIDGIVHTPEKALARVDVVFNALHGQYGEDGKVQKILEAQSKPFTGSGSLASALGMNKVLSKKIFNDHKLQTPKSQEIESSRIRVRLDDITRKLFHSLILPVVVKPADGGSSVGVSIVRSYADLAKALNDAAEQSNTVMIEEFIQGVEATCGVIESFRGHDVYALPVVEIRSKNHFFDYDAKYNGQSDEIVPATFPLHIKKEIEAMAVAAHKALGLRHYSRSDFIIHPRRGIYILETNTLPGLTEKSLIPRALEAVGSGIHELAAHILRLAYPYK